MIIMNSTNDSKSTNTTRSPTPERPPLPPRPSELNLLKVGPSTGHGAKGNSRAGLVAGATTALSVTDVNAYTRSDGGKESKSSPVRITSSPSMSRLVSTRNSETGDDSSSIRSGRPDSRQVTEAESIFGGGIEDSRNQSPTRLSDADFDEVCMDDRCMKEDSVDFDEEFQDVESDGVEDEEGEEIAHQRWKSKRKHFIILSAAGKPIYTRHGSDGIISSYVGIMQTIIASYHSTGNQLRSFQAGDVKFVILSQTNLFLVGISSMPESESQIRVQLEALYMQILSTLTLPHLTHIFSVRPSTDLRRPLQGTEVLLSSLADSFTRGSPTTLLSALECLKIRKSHRTVINSTLIRARVDELLYGLVVAGGRLVSVLRPKKHSLHPSDLQLIFNMLFEAEGVKAGGGDSWIPICLPGFNKTGYLYMYVSFLDMGGDAVRELEQDERIAKEDAVAIILLSADKEAFESMRSVKAYIINEFHRNRSMAIIQSAVRLGRPSISDIASPLDPTGKDSSSGGVPLRHFLYKSRSHVQFFMPTLSPHYDSLGKRRQLMSLYHVLHASVHAKHAGVRVHHGVSAEAATLAWVTPMFELYCVAGPNTPRHTLAQSANKIIQWVSREEERIFIVGGAVF